jgi:hypothetical protein
MMNVRKCQKKRKKDMRITRNKIQIKRIKEKANSKKSQMRRRPKWQPGILRTCQDFSENFIQV